MEAGDKLLPDAVKAQCDSAIRILEQDNQHIESVQKHLQDFIADDELVSEAYSTLKAQINDYLSVISAMLAANELDIADLQAFKASVGKEDLRGEVILPNKDGAYADRNEYNSRASACYAQAEEEPWYSAVRAWHLERAGYYSARALLAQRRYDTWAAKERKFDEINATTRNLFTQSRGLRSAAQRGMEGITKAFRDGGYVIDGDAGWRKALQIENNKRLRQIKEGFLTEKEDGEPEYDWDKIGEWLKKDADEVSDLEYLAFIDLMSEMSDEELGMLLTKAQLEAEWFGSGYHTSSVMEEASERYLLVALAEAKLTILTEHSRYDYDEAEMTNQLSKAYLIDQVLENMHPGEDAYIVRISSEELQGKLTYTAEITLDLSAKEEKADRSQEELTGITAMEKKWEDALKKDGAERVIRVNPWGSVALAEKDMEDGVNATLISLDTPPLEVVFQSIGFTAAGNLLGKVNQSLSYATSAVGLFVDIKENRENAAVINGSRKALKISQAIEALGIRTGVISVTGTGVNEVRFICPEYDQEELMVRVEAYNSVHTEDRLTVAEVKAALADEGEALEKYMDWYYEEEGDDDIAEYWIELQEVLNEYRNQNPEIVIGVAQKASIAQLQELIHKKNDPSYEIDKEVMKE